MNADEGVNIGANYPFAQFSQAVETAFNHPDAGARERAITKLEKWGSVISGMASGALSIGSRRPSDLPEWVTPEVLRGGFATGGPVAGGELIDYELELARARQIPLGRNTRRQIFDRFLSEQGLLELDRLLSGRMYAVDVPEEGALLAVAWLVRAGDPGAALSIVQQIRPFAGRLRFAPRPTDEPPLDRSVVWRRTAGDVRTALHNKKPNQHVAAMNEVLRIWNPFTDELLVHWLETVDESGSVASTFAPDWIERSMKLRERYEQLARQNTHARKHLNPKENLAIMLQALRVKSDGELDERSRRLLQHVVDSMISKRGIPGSAEHKQLRETQRIDSNRPRLHEIARLVENRLSEARKDRGLDEPSRYLQPFDEREGAVLGLQANTAVPQQLRKVVMAAQTGTPESLVQRGVVQSSESLAALVPKMTAATVSQMYHDDDLGHLMASLHEAFSRRRSLLLLNFERQVSLNELPWVVPMRNHQSFSPDKAEAAVLGVARIVQLNWANFPATMMPNALVSELRAVTRLAGIQLPLVEELAADIFMGSFTPKFLQAAKLAARLLDGSLYERYYDIDYRRIVVIDDLTKNQWGVHSSKAFNDLCLERAEYRKDDFSVARNGKAIEQAQILTTHNLATTLGPFGIGEYVHLDFTDLSARCAEAAIKLAARACVPGNDSPLKSVKNAAYAWRQMIFFLSMLDAEAQSQAVNTVGQRIDCVSHGPARRGLDEAFRGLSDIAGGATFDRSGRSHGGGTRLLGWATGRHWMLDPYRESSGS